MTGFVYFLRCGDFVKIGFSTFPNIRIRHLKTATPYQVELLGKLPGTVEHEKALHRYFSSIKLPTRHEWFHLSDGICDVARNGYPDNLNLKAPEKTRLSDYLSQQQITQSSFALRIGVTAEAVNQWVNGKRSPRPESILDIERETEGAVSFHDWHSPAPSTAENAA